MSRRKRKRYGPKPLTPLQKALRRPLKPAQYCLNCEKMMPDIDKDANGKWFTPHPKQTCSERCYDEARKVGGLFWVQNYHPEIRHLFT